MFGGLEIRVRTARYAYSEQLRRNSTHRSSWGFNAFASFCNVIEKELQSQKWLIGTMAYHLDKDFGFPML
jgi:hypothetical protein